MKNLGRGIKRKARVSMCVMVSGVAGVLAAVVVLTAVDVSGVPALAKVSVVVTDIPSAVDVLTAASVSPTFLAVRAVVGLLAVFGFPAVVASLLLLASLLLASPDVPVISFTFTFFS
jgi:hypothetical protein